MVKLVLYGKTEEFFQYITKLDGQRCTFIAPSPKLADLVRSRNDSVGSPQDCLTIAKFLQQEQQVLFPDSDLNSFKSKSELLLVLGTIWSRVSEEKQLIEFKKAFNLLTEFRSFSVADQVLETVLEHYDEKLAHGVMWLHRLLNQLGYMDEHKRYFNIAEQLRLEEPPIEYETDRTLLFYGFDYMTASQVDLLKAFALRDEVIVPFYKEAFESATGLDWIKWFDEHSLEVVDLGEPLEISKDSLLYSYSKGYMARELQAHLDLKDNASIVLANKNLTRESLFDIPISSIKLKVPIDIFEEKFLSVSKNVESYLDKGELSIENFTEKLSQLSLNYIKQQDFRKLKICLLFMGKLREWHELSEDNIIIDHFIYEIFKESVTLDIPRVNLALLESKFNYELGVLSDMESIKDSSVFFALSSKSDGLKGVGSNFSENVEKYLTSIGPIRRAQLDKEVLRCKFKEFISDNDVIMLVESGLIEHDSSIASLVEGIPFTKKDKIEYKKIDKKPIALEAVKTEVLKISASRLQKYMECPSKYNLIYGQKLAQNLEVDFELTPMELGQIEHKVIETYFESKSTWDENFLDQTIEKVIDSFLTNRKIENCDEYTLEVKSYTQSTVIKLIELSDKLKMKFQFEKPIKVVSNEIQYRGSIDFVGIASDFKLILDFKRSNSLFDTYLRLANFEQIQLWFYTLAMKRMKQLGQEESVGIGYIDLSHFENSLIITNDKNIEQTLKGLWKKIKIKYYPEFDTLISEYEELETKLLEKLKSDQTFYPAPISGKVCRYCTLTNVCPRTN